MQSTGSSIQTCLSEFKHLEEVYKSIENSLVSENKRLEQGKNDGLSRIQETNEAFLNTLEKVNRILHESIDGGEQLDELLEIMGRRAIHLPTAEIPITSKDGQEKIGRDKTEGEAVLLRVERVAQQKGIACKVCEEINEFLIRNSILLKEANEFAPSEMSLKCADSKPYLLSKYVLSRLKEESVYLKGYNPNFLDGRVFVSEFSSADFNTFIDVVVFKKKELISPENFMILSQMAEFMIVDSLKKDLLAWFDNYLKLLKQNDESFEKEMELKADFDEKMIEPNRIAGFEEIANLLSAFHLDQYSTENIDQSTIFVEISERCQTFLNKELQRYLSMEGDQFERALTHLSKLNLNRLILSQMFKEYEKIFAKIEKKKFYDDETFEKLESINQTVIVALENVSKILQYLVEENQEQEANVVEILYQMEHLASNFPLGIIRQEKEGHQRKNKSGKELTVLTRPNALAEQKGGAYKICETLSRFLQSTSMNTRFSEFAPSGVSIICQGKPISLSKYVLNTLTEESFSFRDIESEEIEENNFSADDINTFIDVVVFKKKELINPENFMLLSQMAENLETASLKEDLLTWFDTYLTRLESVDEGVIPLQEGRIGIKHSREKSNRIPGFELIVNLLSELNFQQNVSKGHDKVTIFTLISKQCERFISKELQYFLSIQEDRTSQGDQFKTAVNYLATRKFNGLSLNFSKCKSLKDEHVALLVALPITKLNLRRCKNITNSSLEMISNFNQLQSLNLSGCEKIDDVGLKFLAGLHSLRVLELTGCYKIQGEGFKYLPPLEVLSLSGCYQMKHAIYFANINTEKLKSLSLISAAITDEVLDLLADPEKYKALKELNLSRNNISLEGIKKLLILGQVDSAQGLKTLTLNTERFGTRMLISEFREKGIEVKFGFFKTRENLNLQKARAFPKKNLGQIK